MAEAGKDYKHIMRVVNTDLDGAKPVCHALNKIKGVSFMLANAVCHVANVDKAKLAGKLSQDEVKRLEAALKNPLSKGIPLWMINRRKDMETGDDRHVVGSDLRWVVENDIKLMRKTKSYSGFRHAARLPVRGQKTKSNFRNKRGTKSLGVKRKKK